MSAPLQDPSLIDDRFRLEFELGAGAFGSVYKATQVVMGTDMRGVALKLFHTTALAPDTVKELMNDATQILNVLSSLTEWEIRQHFVTVYDLGVTREAKPRGYVSMELVNGGSLKGRLTTLKRLTIPNAFHYLLQIARAMAFMHQQDFVHSDLKPDNILIFGHRDVDLLKLGDFGLAGQYVGPFADGPRGGTMSYMAPEALGGFATTLGCDVFSMGVMAYEMVTGSNPYNSVGQSLDVTANGYHQKLTEMHMASREIPLRLSRDDFPELTGDLRHYLPLLDVINRMTESDISKRYFSAVPVFRDLQCIAEKRLPTLDLHGAAMPDLSESITPVADRTSDKRLDDDVSAGDRQHLVSRVRYHSARREWNEAMNAAMEAVKQFSDRPLGYQLHSDVLRAQAKLVDAKVATMFRQQAITSLNRGLNRCPDPKHQDQLWNQIAETYEEMGDNETAEQVRRRGA